LSVRTLYQLIRIVHDTYTFLGAFNRFFALTLIRKLGLRTNTEAVVEKMKSGGGNEGELES